MATNHGEIKPEPTPRAKAPFIPRLLQRGLTTYSDYDKNVVANGLWEVKVLVPFQSRGQKLEVGDTVKLPGNEAKDRARSLEVEFSDERAAREAKVAKEAEELGLNQPPQPRLENFPPRERKPSWVKGEPVAA